MRQDYLLAAVEGSQCGENMHDIYDMYCIWRAPCVFCGYDGPNFFQVGSHPKTCPFHDIGGVDERLERVERMVGIIGSSLKDGKKTIDLQRLMNA